VYTKAECGLKRIVVCVAVGVALLFVSCVWLVIAICGRPSGASGAKHRDLKVVEDVVLKGVDFLVSQQHRAGHWTDFQTTVGQSDEWVTAVVAFCLGEAGAMLGDVVGASREKAMQWLQARERSMGWGFNSTVAADADSTAWALRAGARFNGTIALYQDKNGGVKTYTSHRIAEWAMPQCDVTANLLLAVAGQDDLDRGFSRGLALRFLVTGQGDDGVWPAYWWNSPFYATALAAEVLIDVEGFEEEVGRAVHFIGSNQNDDGGWGVDRSTVVDTALCVRLLVIARCVDQEAGLRDSLKKGIHWLCEGQNPDGSWDPSAQLRISVPTVSRAEQLHSDANRVFGSALAVAGLARALEGAVRPTCRVPIH